MNFSFVIIISLCLLTSLIKGQEISLSKHGCPQKCGDITIPYPFGIGPNCSFNSSYTVECSESHPPKAFLKTSGLEAIEFFLNENTVRVMQNVSPLNCSSRKGELQVGQSVVDTPFTLGAAINRLVVVGCRSEVSLSNQGACRPTCGDPTASAGCYGIICCTVIVPPMSQRLPVNYSTFEGGNVSAICGYVFLADYRWLTSDYEDYMSLWNYSVPMEFIPQLKSVPVPVMLEWRLDMVPENLQGVVCENRSVEAHTFDDNTHTFNTSRCRCDRGFQGNPYLPEGGCVDIDECRNSTLNDCVVGTDCVNTFGSFRCRERSGNNQMKSVVIGISSGMGALLLLGFIWLLSKLIKKRIRANRKRRFFKRNGGLLLEQRLSTIDGGFEKIKLFEAKELARATDGYDEDRILGRGGQGTVYKGMLRDGRIVAVKKLKRMDEGDVEGFVNEVVILSQINHRNVVKLLGCCLETEVPLLVSEFVPSGTLFEHIHDRNKEFSLSWKMRVRIAAQVAGALSYLHNSASSPIYHRDIKSTNILLDGKYRAKVSDFGISRSVAIDQTHLSTRVRGTFGYLDPEYFWSSKFTEKSDVYSFGVVLVEILTGEKAISDAGIESGRNLAADFLYSMVDDHLFDMLDPEVLKGGVNEIVTMADLARRCLNPRGNTRPTMKEVAMELEGIRMMVEKDFQSIDFDEDCVFSDTTNLTVSNANSSDSPLLCED
ncbi:hypothetical protein C2S51_004267 [Perilla frutescens var. frutescens]|nr:hypothetical protein C2S51_004267 [Perilla frutescens var. frutescens]